MLCVGLDPQPELLPDAVWRGVRAGPAGTARAVERFCLGVIDAVAEHAVAVKPQLAFFEALGHHGLAAFEQACERARERGLLVVVDGKRGDIASTSAGYAAAYLREAPGRGDVLTVNPYLGLDSLQPFLDACAARPAGGCSCWCARPIRAGLDLQELALAGGGRVWEHVARLVADAGDALEPDAALAPVGAVFGATQPQLLARARELMPRAPFLLPGIGAQGGSVDELGPAFAPGPGGGLVAASRSVLYAWRDSGAGAADWPVAVEAEAARLRAASWRVVEQAAARV